MCQDCDNIILRIEAEMKAKFQAYQESKKGKYGLKVGDFVKTQFKLQDGRTEHMWVRITKIVKEDGIVQGEINNNPFFLDSPYKLGKMVLVLCKLISEHLDIDQPAF